MQAREEGDDGDDGDPRRDRGDDPASARCAGAEDGEGEGAEVAGNASEVGGGPLGALGPAQAEGRPDDEGGEQRQRDTGKRGRAAARQGADHDAGEEEPPDRDPDPIMDKRVVAAPFEAEVDDEAEAERP